MQNSWLHPMLHTLASAPLAPTSDSNVELVLISSGTVVVVGILAMVPTHLARGHRHREALVAIVILWGLITAGSCCYSVMQQMDWSSTYTQRIETGYYDPQDTSDQPKPLIGLWCGLGVGYVCLIIWANASQKTGHPPKMQAEKK